MMAGVATTCEECEGKRFQASVLDDHLGGRPFRLVLRSAIKHGFPVSESFDGIP